MNSSQSDPWMQPTDISNIARSQYHNHHRRVTGESAHQDPQQMYMPEPNGYGGYSDLAPVPREFTGMGISPMLTGPQQQQSFPNPNPYHDEPDSNYLSPNPPPPPPPARRPTVLRKRSSRRISNVSVADNRDNLSREGSRTPPKLRRKLSRSSSRRTGAMSPTMIPPGIGGGGLPPMGIPPPMMSGPGGFGSPDPYHHPPYITPYSASARPYRRDSGCGCVIC